MTFPVSVRPSSLRVAVLAGALALPIVGASSLALASSGMGVIAMPDVVTPEIAEGKAAIRATGVFYVVSNGSDPCYAEPQCGTVYYTCPAGSEALCAMEWKELAAAATAGKCVAFGSPRTTGTPQNNGRVHPPGEALGQPDAYPLGFGLRVVGCTKSDLLCGTVPDLVAARAARCPDTASDAGTASDTPPATTGTGGATGTGGTTAGSGSGGAGATSPPAQPARDGKSGCALAGERPGHTAAGAGALGAALLALRWSRRRRKSALAAEGLRR